MQLQVFSTSFVLTYKSTRVEVFTQSELSSKYLLYLGRHLHRLKRAAIFWGGRGGLARQEIVRYRLDRIG